jgi:UDP-N-acetylglucosamine 2-epimerase
MKVLTVVGARPQFIKAAPVSQALAAAGHHEVLVHTGQHYDPLMSDVFFAELGLRAPDHALHVGSAAHGAQTGRMLEAIEEVLLDERPDALLVYGDTNSTLAGALAASKHGVPIVHVEAGLRSHKRAMPEEINRVLTDHVSTLCCCPSETAAAHLAAEGITRGVRVVGDVMYDALLAMRDRLAAEGALAGAGTEATGGADAPVLVTLHRPANTDDPAQLARLVRALGGIEGTVRWPVHPRTQQAMQTAGVTLPSNVTALAPLGYRDLVATLASARAVVTDSGGLQKEAYWLGTPCLTVRTETEWTETIAAGWNRLVDITRDDLGQLVRDVSRPAGARDAYGAPGASARIVAVMEETLGGVARADDAAHASPRPEARAA